jgi:hypothetical protein
LGKIQRLRDVTETMQESPIAGDVLVGAFRDLCVVNDCLHALSVGIEYFHRNYDTEKERVKKALFERSFFLLQSIPSNDKHICQIPASRYSWWCSRVVLA